jgi:hypothetical protein
MGATKISRIAFLLASASVAMTGTSTCISATLPPDVGNPFFDYYVHQFLVGNFTDNLSVALGLKGHLSLAPLMTLVALGFCYIWRRCAQIQDDIEQHKKPVISSKY